MQAKIYMLRFTATQYLTDFAIKWNHTELLLTGWQTFVYSYHTTNIGNNWGYVDMNGSWTGAIRMVMDGVSAAKLFDHWLFHEGYTTDHSTWSPFYELHIMASSNGTIFRVTRRFFAGNSSVTGEFLLQRPMTRSFDILFDLHLNNGDAGDFRRNRAHSDAFSWMKIYKFRLRFHLNLFPNVDLTIF